MASESGGGGFGVFGGSLGYDKAASLSLAVVRRIDVDEHGRAVGEVAFEHRERNAVAELALDHSLERPRTECRIVTQLGDTAACCRCDVKAKATLGQASS